MIKDLKAGEKVLISGTIYTARDAAHIKFMELLKEGKDLPVDLEGQIIYYVGPTPTPPGKIIGSAGPTTSSRMDKMTPSLLEMGLKGIIGKGNRSKEVLDSLTNNKAVYFAALGGAGAILAKSVKSSEIVAFPELGTEAVRKLLVENFPAVVVIDIKGNNAYEEGPLQYKKQK
jgi:fumarate hydratase subunit beta